MTPYVARIVRRIRDTEEDLTRRFEQEIRHSQRRFRQSIPAFVREASILSALTTPILYSLVLPLALLDFWVTVYQWICFPIFGISRVRRGAHFAIDRHKLAYLNGIEKVNCTYCSYANGLIAYGREIAARTEQYWCPIKHARSISGRHSRYGLFFDYGDAEGYRRDLSTVRHMLRDELAANQPDPEEARGDVNGAD
jgi:hypothetical protein